MVLPTSPEMQRLAAQAARQWARDQENLLRDLLGRWVSELEPTIIYDSGSFIQIAGIGMRGDPEGRIIIEAPGRHGPPYASRGLLDHIPHSLIP